MVEFWMRTGPQKDQVMVTSLKLSAPTPHSPEREEGPEMEIIIHCTFLCDYASIQVPEVQCLKSFQLAPHLSPHTLS